MRVSRSQFSGDNAVLGKLPKAVLNAAGQFLLRSPRIATIIAPTPKLARLIACTTETAGG